MVTHPHASSFPPHLVGCASCVVVILNLVVVFAIGDSRSWLSPVVFVVVIAVDILLFLAVVVLVTVWRRIFSSLLTTALLLNEIKIHAVPRIEQELACISCLL